MCRSELNLAIPYMICITNCYDILTLPHFNTTTSIVDVEAMKTFGTEFRLGYRRFQGLLLQTFNTSTVVQLSLTIARYVLHRGKRQNFITVTSPKPRPFVGDMPSCCYNWYSLHVYEMWRLHVQPLQ